MTPSRDRLITLVEDLSPAAVNPVLVHSFSGFMDAGSSAQLAVNHLLDNCDERIVATFDSDELIDYRARRPKMIFDRNRFINADMPRITLREVLDDRGTPFLLLSGPEPDYRWNEFLGSVRWLVRELNVGLSVGLVGIPWPVPHTRPIGMTWHGTDQRLYEGHTSTLGVIEVPGHMQALIEWSLGQHDHDAMGLAVHVPHYLTQFEYPRAAIALLRGLAVATGLQLPTDGLEEQAQQAEDEIERQTSDSEEFDPLLRALEEQYDSGLEPGYEPDEDEQRSSTPLPNADEIGLQVERFLAEMDDRGDAGG